MAIVRRQYESLRSMPQGRILQERRSVIAGHEIRHLGVVPGREILHCMNDTKRAVLWGAGPSKLKDHYHVPVLLIVIVLEPGREGF